MSNELEVAFQSGFQKEAQALMDPGNTTGESLVDFDDLDKAMDDFGMAIKSTPVAQGLGGSESEKPSVDMSLDAGSDLNKFIQANQMMRSIPEDSRPNYAG